MAEIENILHIKVVGKVAELTEQNFELVGGNSDYKVIFDFDSAWEGHGAKTALFVFGDKTIHKPFDGDVCEGVAVSNCTTCYIGVFSGDIITTTSATVCVRQSITDIGGMPQDPEPSVYNEIIDLINQKVTGLGEPYEDIPEMDGEGFEGDTARYARGNHRHPTDTSRASAADLTALSNRVGELAQSGAEQDATIREIGENVSLQDAKIATAVSEAHEAIEISRGFDELATAALNTANSSLEISQSNSADLDELKEKVSATVDEVIYIDSFETRYEDVTELPTIAINGAKLVVFGAEQAVFKYDASAKSWSKYVDLKEDTDYIVINGVNNGSFHYIKESDDLHRTELWAEDEISSLRNNKLDKVTTSYTHARVYAVDETGAQDMRAVDPPDDAEEKGIPTRNSNYCIYLPNDPIEPHDSVNMRYVNDCIATVDDRVTDVVGGLKEVKEKVKDVTNVMDFVGASTTDPLGASGATVEGVTSFQKGDVVVYGNKEYVYDGTAWREYGDTTALSASITELQSRVTADEKALADYKTDTNERLSAVANDVADNIGLIAQNSEDIEEIKGGLGAILYRHDIVIDAIEAAVYITLYNADATDYSIPGEGEDIEIEIDSLLAHVTQNTWISADGYILTNAQSKIGSIISVRATSTVMSERHLDVDAVTVAESALAPLSVSDTVTPIIMSALPNLDEEVY